MGKPNYYSLIRSKLIKEFESASKTIKIVLSDRFDKKKAEKIIFLTRSQYLDLIPKLPYIENKNEYSKSLVGSVWFLALFRVLEAEDLNYNEIGEIFETQIKQSLVYSNGLLENFLEIGNEKNPNILNQNLLMDAL